MQTALRPRVPIRCPFRSLTQSVCTISRPKCRMQPGFFSRRPLQSHRPSFALASLRRAFSSAHSRDPWAAYQSSRRAVLGFIGLNAAVFATWQYATAKQDRALLTWMSKNFVLSLQNNREGRYYTMITSAISHVGLAHFAFNMMTFYAFGSIVSAVGIGGPSIMSLCLGSAVTGSVAFYYQQLHQSTKTPVAVAALGASGVVMGMGAAATCLMPFAPMQIMFIPINIPLWVLTLLYAGLDTYYLHDARSRVGHAAHLGGSVYGILFYAFFLRRYGGIANMLKGGMRR